MNILRGAFKAPVHPHPPGAARTTAAARYVLSIAAILAVYLVPLPAPAAPILTVTERALESVRVSCRIDNRGHGTAKVAFCQQCATSVTLLVSPRTRLVIDERERPAKDLARVRSQVATVYYLPESRRVTRIVIGTPAEPG